MKKEYLAVIQAGGKGTRMVSLTKDKIPKPMLSLNGKPMIQWQMENLIEYGIRDFVIITGHLGEIIEEHFGNGKQLGIHITYVRETEPLGSAGALYFIKEMVETRDVILVFGDVMIKVYWDKMISFHEEKESMATLLVHPNSHPGDSDLLITNPDGQVVEIDSKDNTRNYWYENLVNAGIYILNYEVINSFKNIKKRDLEKDVLTPLMKTGRVYGYRTPEYVKDAGTPERFKKCCQEQKDGIWEEKCLIKKQKAIFLDRDGTINKYKGLVYKDEQLELEDCAAEAIRNINSMGYLAICVTNQPVVARGMCEIEDVKHIHCKLQTLLGQSGAYLDDIVFCPHHPDKGYPEENVLYKVDCNCRKPAIGMIERMAEKYNIDLSNSWMIGDSTVDIMLGKNAGTKTILVKTGQAGTDKKYQVHPDYTAGNILSAVMLIKEKER